MILLLKSYPYHFVRTILYVPFCPIPFCPSTILSIPFCPYHFVRYHFVRSPYHCMLAGEGKISSNMTTSEFYRTQKLQFKVPRTYLCLIIRSKIGLPHTIG